MFEVICPTCNKKNLFESRDSIAEECGYCFEVFPPSIQVSDSPEQNGVSASRENGEVSGLVLIYQIDQRQITIDVSEKTILGRKSHGAEILSTIYFNDKPVISRQHCSIEFINGDFYLRDENSLNGTFYGIKKMSCKNSPQKIENDNILYLGEEPFIARIIQKEPEAIVQSEAEAVNKGAENIVLYRCNECGLEKQEKLPMCPVCDTFNSFVEISEKN